jgi:hypothetical protein
MLPDPCGKQRMFALDTNIIARFYVDDPHDTEAVKQRPIAHRIFVDSPALFVPLKTENLQGNDKCDQDCIQ